MIENATRLSSAIKHSPVAVRRMIETVAQTLGVPLLLIQPLAVPKDRCAAMPSELADGMEWLAYESSIDSSLPWWIDLFQHHEMDIIPIGRIFDSPFLTLLRDDPLFYWWELLTYAKKIEESGNVGHLGGCHFPGLFADILTYGLIKLEDLDVWLVVGPVPLREHRALRGGPLCPAEGFREIINEITGHQRKSSEECHPALKPRSPSADRLRRMFYFGGSFSQREFNQTIHCVSYIIKTATAALIDGDHLARHSALIVSAAEAAAQSALLDWTLNDTVVRREPNQMEIGTQNLTATFPIGGDLGLWHATWPSESRAASPIQLSHFDLDWYTPESTGKPRQPPTAEVKGRTDDNITLQLHNLLRRSGDRATQEMLQQLTIGRNWIHDRFAQLSGITDSASSQSAELKENADRICRWLMRLFYADYGAIYRAVPASSNSESKILKRFGSAERNKKGTKFWSRFNRDRMRLSEDDSSLQINSMCYRALWTHKFQTVRDWDGKLHIEGMLGPSTHETFKNRPRAAVAVPILIFGRVWGVIELVGFTPYQFDTIDPLWLEEFCALIGDQFFHVCMLADLYKTNALILGRNEHTHQEHDGSIYGDINTDDLLVSAQSRYQHAMDKICEGMATIFLADGAAIWLEDEFWPGRFELTGLFGIEDDPFRKSPRDRPKEWSIPYIDRDDPKSIIIRAVDRASTKQNVINPNRVIQEDITEADMLDQTINPSRTDYRRRQWSCLVRHVAVIPLVVTGNNIEGAAVIGAIALLTKRPIQAERKTDVEVRIFEDTYPESWAPLFNFAGSQAALLIRTLRLETHRQNQIELMFSHSVLASAVRISDQQRYVSKNVLQQISGLPDSVMQELRLDKDRVRSSVLAAGRVAAEADILTGKLQDWRRNGFELTSIPDFRRPRSDRDRSVSIGSVLRDAFNSRNDIMKRRNIPPTLYTGPVEEYVFRFQSFTRGDIDVVLENLADNAFKYTPQSQRVSVRVRKMPGTITLSVRNKGERFPPNEERRILRSRRFRGSAAERSNEVGSGNGLYISKMLCNQVGIDLFYDFIEENSDERLNSFHEFTLTMSDVEFEHAGR